VLIAIAIMLFVSGEAGVIVTVLLVLAVVLARRYFDAAFDIADLKR